jgi:hypothetical protein
LFCLEGVEGINFWGKGFHTNNTLLKPLTLLYEYIEASF